MDKILGIRTISFNTNGGSAVSSQELWRDEKVKQPADPSKDGYDFIGWYVDNDTFNTPWNFNVVPTGNMTLHAKWNETTPYELELVLDISGLTN